MKKEVIQLNVMWYGGQFGFCLDENSSKINDSKLNHFWKKVEELGLCHKQLFQQKHGFTCRRPTIEEKLHISLTYIRPLFLQQVLEGLANKLLTAFMSQVIETTTGAVLPLAAPRIQTIREQISIQELELRLARLGMPTTSKAPAST